MSALVTNAEMLIALSVTRSLGKSGVKVTCGSDRTDSLCFHSKYCKNKTVYPSPTKEDLFINHLEDNLKKQKHEVLIPTFADSLLAVSKHREQLEEYTTIPIPAHDKIVKALDKTETLKIAKDNGIPIPETAFIEDIKDVEKIKNEIGYPAVLKPAASFGAKGVSYIKSPEELTTAYRINSSEHGEKMLLQECIPLEGEIYGFEALLNKKSELRAGFVHKRLRHYPLTGGQSTLRESVKNPEVEKLGLKLLKALGWYGVAMVEFKIDPRDGKPKLMEINPRFWGSLHLPLVSGMNFPYLLYKMAVEGDIEPITEYKVGVKSRALYPGDLNWLFSALRDDYASLGLKKQSKIKVLSDFLKFYEKDLHYELFYLDDPMPGLYEIGQTIRRKTKRGVGV